MAEEKRRIFSRAALEKLHSPEKLDLLLPVTSPMGWMGLGAIILLLISVSLWAVFGSFTDRVNGMGLIMDSGGLVNITHTAGGRLINLHVREGTVIKRGDLIAHMEHAEKSADSHMAQYGTQLAESMRDTALRAYQYKSKMYQQEVSSDVLSEYDGVVYEILVQEGSVVERGTPIATVRLTRTTEDLVGVMYIPVDKAKRVQSGQTIHVVPNGVDELEAGSMIGVVRTVSDYPVSLQSMERNLGNTELAKWILENEGAAVEVKFDLVKDETNESGYLWTSRVGDIRPVTAGSFVTGSIIIDRHPPIERVFYRISQWIGNR